MPRLNRWSMEERQFVAADDDDEDLGQLRGRLGPTSSEFDLGRSDRRRPVVALSYEARQLHPFRLPSVMDERSCERRRAADPADQTVIVRSISGRDGDFRSFAFFAHGAYPEMFQEDGPASLMQDASGGADLRIAVAGDVVHQEVDQASLFLKNGKKIDDLGVGLYRRWDRGGGADRFGGGPDGRRLWPLDEEGEEKQKGDPRDSLRQH